MTLALKPDTLGPTYLSGLTLTPILCLSPTLFQLQRPKVPSPSTVLASGAFAYSSCLQCRPEPPLRWLLPSPSLSPVAPSPEQPSLTPTDSCIQANEAKLVSASEAVVFGFVFVLLVLGSVSFIHCLESGLLTLPLATCVSLHTC